MSWKRIFYLKFVNKINHQDIYEELLKAQQFDAQYIIMTVFSALIATSGLIINSPAVIIGAMIISPLMGPIMAGGLFFAIGDYYLGKKAFKSISLGVIIAVVSAVLVTLIYPLKVNTPEIIARTSPNIIDLFIALVCGLAGAFSINFKKTASSIVGVAISVALMPPLCVTGIGISTSQLNVALGGFFLFFTNLTSIFIASTISFLILGFSRNLGKTYNHKKIIIKYLIPVGLLLVLSLPLMYSLKTAIDKKTLNNKINNLLIDNLNIPNQSKLDSWEIIGDTIVAKINTTSYLPQEKIDFIDKQIDMVTKQKISLTVYQVPVLLLSQDVKQSGTPAILNAISGNTYPNVETASVIDKNSDQIVAGLENLELAHISKLYPYIESYKLEYDKDNNFKSIVISLKLNYDVSIEQIESIINYLQNKNDKITIKVMSNSILLPTIYFKEEKYTIEESEQNKLPALATFLNSQKQYTLKVAGYADSTGNVYFNDYLSNKRAEVTRDYFLHSNISPERIIYSYYGERMTNEEIELETGRQSQRRVDLKLLLTQPLTDES